MSFYCSAILQRSAAPICALLGSLVYCCADQLGIQDANSVSLKAWKANILFRHADETHQQRGTTETLQLCKADPAVTDLDTLDILYETLQKMGENEETMRSIWERAAKAKPQLRDIQTKWFNIAFEGDDWKSAQKVCVASLCPLYLGGTLDLTCLFGGVS